MNTAIENDWELEPFVRVGIFPLGKTLPPNFEKELLERRPDEETAEEGYTKFNIIGSEAFLTVDADGVVQHINCDDACNYKGVNLIGKTLEEVEALLGHEAVAYMPDIIVGAYNIDKLEVMLWTDDNGLVKTVDCGMYIDPDEV